jgi:hypothetical protein
MRARPFLAACVSHIAVPAARRVRAIGCSIVAIPRRVPRWNRSSADAVARVVRPPARRRWGLTLALLVLIVSCARQPSGSEPASSQPVGTPAPSQGPVQQVTETPLPGSGYIYDVAVGDDAVWVTSNAGLYRIDLPTGTAALVLANDYVFKLTSGHGSIWISTGQDGRVLRVDPGSNAVTAEITLGGGPVTELAVSPDAVWASAIGDLVRIDPETNEVVGRVRSAGSFGDVAFGEGSLWAIAGAGDDGAVWRIDAATGDVRQRIPLANPSFWNEIEAGEGAVWVTSSPIAHRDAEPLVHLYRIDPSAGSITGDVALGDGASGLGPGEGATSLTTLALGERAVWAVVEFDGDLFRIDPQNLDVSELPLASVVGRSSDVGSGLAVGAGAVWITSPEAVTRVDLET